MELQNNPENENEVIANQEDSANVATNLSTKPVEDMELNEEQLDIISGGGDVNKLIITG